LATSGVWIRLLLPTKPYISQSRHDRAQDSLAPGGKTTRSSVKMLGEAGHHEHRALLLMLGVLRRIGQHGGRYDPSTVKRREKAITQFVKEPTR